MELLGIHGYVRRNFETFEFIKLSATQNKLFIYTDRVQQSSPSYRDLSAFDGG